MCGICVEVWSGGVCVTWWGGGGVVICLVDGVICFMLQLISYISFHQSYNLCNNYVLNSCQDEKQLYFIS